MSEPPANMDGARAASRLGSDYVLRSLQILGELAGGDLITGVISLAIVMANVGHLEDGAFRDLDQVPPDAVRRPISILALANSLGMPYETTRRYVEKLIAAGQCVRVKGGVIVPTETLASPVRREMLVANLGNLRRLYRGLRRAGVSLD